MCKLILRRAPVAMVEIELPRNPRYETGWVLLKLKSPALIDVMALLYEKSKFKVAKTVDRLATRVGGMTER